MKRILVDGRRVVCFFLADNWFVFSQQDKAFVHWKEIKIITHYIIIHHNFLNLNLHNLKHTNLLSRTLPRIFFRETNNVCRNGAEAVFKLKGRNSRRSFCSISDKGSEN